MLIILVLVACSNDGAETLDIMTNEYDPHMELRNLEPRSGIMEPINDDIVEVLVNLYPIPYLISHQLMGLNKISLIDLTSGETIAYYKFDVDYQIHDLWDLGNGYYAVHVWRIDDETFSDIDHQVIIFGEYLEKLEVIFYDVEATSPLFFGILALLEGELIAYTMEPGHVEQIREPLNLMRFNMHTGEIENLIKMDEYVGHLHQFIGENQIFITDRVIFFDEGRMSSKYGILDLETELTHFFIKEDFGYGHIDFRDSQVLISEGFPVGPPLRNEVIVFDVENMSSKIVQLEDREGIWARFSFEGNHIVTINVDEFVFRKYDFSGIVVAEIELERPSHVENVSGFEDFTDFEIFSITDEIYAIHTSVSSALDRHIQFIILP